MLTAVGLRGTRSLAGAFALLSIALVPGASAREDDDPLSDSVGAMAVVAEQSRAVEQGLAWLAAKQQGGGFWGQESDTRIADTSIALLALMAGGNTVGPGARNRAGVVSDLTHRGPYAKHVERGLEFLARRAFGEKRPGVPLGYIDGDQVSKMHGHGYATLALASACGNLGASRVEDIRKRIDQGLDATQLPYADRIRWGLECAVRLTERTQDPDTGGWYYDPRPEGHEGSMTVTQVVALRSARDAGVAVNRRVIDHAQNYVRRSQNLANREYYGGFAYQVNRPDKVTYALTAAALTTFFATGRYGYEPGDRDMIERGLRYMDNSFESQVMARQSEWYYYQVFYATLALYLSGDERRQAAHWPRIRDEVVNQQTVDGSFSNRRDSARSLEYCTAMACLTLQVPLETLPIFQRR